MKIIIRFTIIMTLLMINRGISQELLINETEKRDVIMKVASIIKDKYVFEDVGEQISRHLLNEYQNKAYDSLSTAEDFCRKITSDMRDINNDKHLFVFYSPEEALEVRARKNLLPEYEIQKINESILEVERYQNFGFKKVEILDGNIGYLDLRYFASPEYFDEKIAGVMNFLSNSDAIIIDLRKNGGGEGSSLLPSYFLSPETIHLGSVCCRDTLDNEYKKTIKNIPGKRLEEIDLYILTSPRTFSAAEYFAYTMKNLNRAVIIGEQTKGGAHPVDVLIVKDDILAQISICESYNPITKSNWEGVGVEPDIKVSAENAIQKAQIIALEKILLTTSDVERINELNSILNDLNEQ